jgi:predicted phosphohydrolase
MKLRYLSDLHLELIKPNKLDKKIISHITPGIDEICILAGDIGNPYKSNYDVFMKFISKNFKKTFVIPGNHEYYKNTIQGTNDFMENYFQQFDNITLLNNNYEIYDNYCFIGTTLWSKITDPSYEINDVHTILDFNYLEYNKLNMTCIEFLENILQNNENCIIITHHVPSYFLIDKKFKSEEMLLYNQWYYCDMDGIIETNKNKIKCWIYGHTHIPSNIIINEIPFVCNPIGYPNENSVLDFQKTITISV